MKVTDQGLGLRVTVIVKKKEKINSIMKRNKVTDHR